MQVVHLADILQDARPGFASGKSDPDGIIQVRMNNVSTDCIFSLEECRRVPSEGVDLQRFAVAEGDILFNSTNSPELVGKSALFPGCAEPVVYSNHFLRLRTKRKISEPAYLAHWLRAERTKGTFTAMCKQWVNQATVASERLLAMRVPLPPLPEQRRIAAILDQADALRAKRREALAKLDEMAQAIYFDTFGDPVRNPKNIRKEPLANLIKLKSGEFLPATNMDEEGSYPVLGGNGINGHHSSYLFEEKQIVIGRVGAYCGCVHVSPPKSWITDNALYVASRAKDLEFDYLTHALIIANLNSVASKFGQPLISGSRVYPVEILVPPIAMQKEFARRIAAMESLQSRQNASDFATSALFSSLQHRAFCGDL